MVLGVTSLYAVVVVAGFAVMGFDARAFVTTVAFSSAAILSVELSMRLAWPRNRSTRTSRDFLGVWMMPLAILLPPPWVAVMVLAPMFYLQMRIWRRDPIKFTYSVAALGLSYAAASAALRAVAGSGWLTPHWSIAVGGARTAAAIGAAVGTWWVINVAIVAAVVVLTGGKPAIRALLRDGEGYLLDGIDACAGIVAALLWSVSPYATILLVPPVLLMQHQLFSGLRQAVRTDLLTDAANPQFWRETAAREIEPATASGTHLAVLMVDIDHFKNVNDQYGHLAGDDVLAAVARTISKALRPGDLVGRLGGEEFGAILGGLNLLDAEGAAERLRAQVDEIRVRSDRGEWISVTVSVGVAELSVTGGGLHQVLGAADSALYAAKAAGRNRVRVSGARAGQAIDLRSSSEIDRAAGLP